MAQPAEQAKRFKMNKLTAVAFFAFVILFPKINLINVPGSQVGIRLEDIFTGGLLVWLLYMFAAQNKWRVVGSDTVNQLWLVFLLWGGMVTIIGYLVFGTIDRPLIALLYWGRHFQFFIVYLFARYTLWTVEGLRRLLSMGAWAALVVFGYAILQYLGLVPYFSTLESVVLAPGQKVNYATTGVLMGTFGGHYDFGVFVAMVLAILFGFAYHFVWKPFGVKVLDFGLKNNLLAILLLAFGVFCLIYSRSRSAYLAFLAVLLYLGWRSRRWWLIYVALGIVLVLAAWFFAGGLSNFPTEVNVGEISFFVDRSNIERLGKWAVVIQSLNVISIMTGNGLSSLGSAVDGYYVRLIGETGLIGLGLFGLLLRAIFVRLRQLIAFAEQRLVVSLAFGLVLASVALLVQAVFIDTFVSSKVMYIYWFLVGVAMQQFALPRIDRA